MCRWPAGDGVGAVLAQFVGAGVTRRGIAGHRAADDRARLSAKVGAQRARIRRGLFGDLADDLPRGAPAKGGLPGDQGEQGGAEGVEVAALVDGGVAARLFGRHVGGRADHRAGTGQAVVEGAREAEVGDFGPAVGVEHEVGRLEVAVQQTGGVDRGESLGGVAHQFQCAPLGHPARGAQQALGIAAQDQFKREERRAFMLTHIQAAHHARMVDGLQRARLAHEARGVVGVLGAHQFKRHTLLGAVRLRQPHRARGALAQRGEQAIAGDVRQDHPQFGEQVGDHLHRQHAIAHRRPGQGVAQAPRAQRIGGLRRQGAAFQRAQQELFAVELHAKSAASPARGSSARPITVSACPGTTACQAASSARASRHHQAPR